MRQVDRLLPCAAHVFLRQSLVAQVLERDLFDGVARPRRVEDVARQHRVELEALELDARVPEHHQTNFRSWPIFAIAGSSRTAFKAARADRPVIAEGSSRAVWPIGRYRARRAAVEKAIPTSDARMPPGQSPITLSANCAGCFELGHERGEFGFRRNAVIGVDSVGRRRELGDERTEAELGEQLEAFLPVRAAIVETGHVDVGQRHVGANRSSIRLSRAESAWRSQEPRDISSGQRRCAVRAACPATRASRSDRVRPSRRFPALP